MRGSSWLVYLVLRLSCGVSRLLLEAINAEQVRHGLAASKTCSESVVTTRIQPIGDVSNCGVFVCRVCTLSHS